MSTVFTKIISGEIPSHKISETENFLAFLDINPNAKGHTLCIPKKEVNKIYDLDDKTYLDLMAFSKKIAEALEASIECKRIGMAVVGLEVPHVHVHLIPINTMDDMRFQKKDSFSEEEFKTIAKSIREKVSL